MALKRFFDRTLNLGRTLGFSENKAYAILVYHQLVEDNDASFVLNQALKVRSSDFKEQMAFISSSCIPIPLEWIVKRVKEKIPPDKFYVAVTFDDGYKDNLTLASPTLYKHQIPSTVFLTTSFIDNQAKPWWDILEEQLAGTDKLISVALTPGTSHDFDLALSSEKIALLNAVSSAVMQKPQKLNDILEALGRSLPPATIYTDRFLTWRELVDWQRKGFVSFAPHTINHPFLIENNKHLFGEIPESRQIIRDHLGDCLNIFAYPYGLDGCFSEEAVKVLETSQFDAACAVRFRYAHDSQDIFRLPRIAIGGNDDMKRFMNKLFLTRYYDLSLRLLKSITNMRSLGHR